MTTLKYHNAFPAAFLLVLALIGGSTVPIAAHPLGGVLQKTVVSNLSNAILIEYNTHFGPEVVLTLHPDKNFNGVLDEEERIQFLDRVNHLLLPNIICRLGTTKLTIEEMDRKLTLEDAGDFKNGLNSQFVWRVSLNKDGKPPEGLFRMQDNNFRASELNQLSYFVTILGDTGPVALADEGRELLWEVSSPKQPAPGSQLAAADTSLPGAGPPVGAMKNQETTNTETDTLRSLLRDSSGSLGLYLFGLVTAFILGAFHGLSPGHGKAMVAAYLVGSQGRSIDAVRLGLIVTVTHIFSVIILGLLALTLSRYTLSRDFIPWLGVASGALIFLTGYFLLARAALSASHHHHTHHHNNHTHQPGETHGHTLQEIFSLGVASGLVPCPTAIVILLFAIAVNRIVTGLLIILSFSLGLATVLILIGVLTVTASRHIERFTSAVVWIRRLPVFTAGIIMVLGVAIGLNALLQAGILTFNLS